MKSIPRKIHINPALTNQLNKSAGNSVAADNDKLNIETFAIPNGNLPNNISNARTSPDEAIKENNNNSNIKLASNEPLLVSSIAPNGTTSAGGDEVGLKQMVEWLGGNHNVNYKKKVNRVYVPPSISNPKGGYQWQEEGTVESITVKLDGTTKEYTFKNGEDFSVGADGISMINKNKILDTFFGDIGTYGEIQPDPRQAINYITRLCYEAGVPVKLGLATAQTESGMVHFKENGDINTNDKNPDGTVDWGMFQINDRWHPVSNEMKTNWHANARYAIQHLAKCYADTKKSGLYLGDELWKATYSEYNSGSRSAYVNENHDAYKDTKEHVGNFWTYYTTEPWRNQQ